MKRLVAVELLMVLAALIHGTCGQCSSTEFQCATGDCIPSTSQCDGLRSCLDGIDEIDCIKCQNGAVRCRIYQCIRESERCDGFPDCRDGSDEIGCPCRPSDQFQCTNGDCVPSFTRCDGSTVGGCSDGSDEMNCRGQFQCSNTQCVFGFRSSDHCDRLEFMISNHPTPWAKPKDKLGCNGQCIRSYHHCNGNLDCTDGSDETGCNTPTTSSTTTSSTTTTSTTTTSTTTTSTTTSSTTGSTTGGSNITGTSNTGSNIIGITVGVSTSFLLLLVVSILITVFGCCIVHASRRPQYTPVINPTPTQPPTTPEPDPISATIEEPSPQQTGTKDAEKDVNPAPEYETSTHSSTSQVAVLFCN